MIVEVEQISTMLGSTLSMLNSHGVFVKLAVYPAWLFFFSLPLYFTNGRLKEMLAFPFGAAIYVLQAVTMREWYVFRIFISLLYVTLFLLYLFVHDAFIGIMLVISFVERYCTNYYYSDLEQFYVHVKDDLEGGISFEKAISKPSTSDAYLALTNLRFRQMIPQELYLKALLSIDIDNTNGFLVSDEVYREICLYLPDYNSNEFFDTIYLVSFMLVIVSHPYLFFLGLGFYNKYTYFISTITVFIVLLNDGEVCFLISFLVCGIVYLFQMNIYTKLSFAREKAAALGFEDVSYKHVRYSRLLLYSTIFFMVLLVDASAFIYRNYHR